MKAFDKLGNRQNEINACWYWFQMVVEKSKMLRSDTSHIVVGKDSKARSLGSCTYYYDTAVSKVTLSPFTVLDSARIRDSLDLFNQVAHTGVHEVCHGIVQKKYWNNAARKITVLPHGREWEWTMREFGILDGKACGGRDFPMIFAETEFLLNAHDLFQSWRHGEFDMASYRACLQSRV